MLPQKLLPNAVQAFDSAFNARGDGMLLHLCIHLVAHFGKKILAHLAAAFDGPLDLEIGLGFEKLERQVFQFASDLSHSQAVGDGRIDLERFPGHAFLPVGRQVLEGAHVMEPVGELHQHHPDVVHHGEDHLAEALGLLLLSAHEPDAADLCHSIHDTRHFRTELAFDRSARRARIFHHVVQHTRDQTHQVQLHLRQDLDDLERMRDEGFTGEALLLGMADGAEVIGPAQRRQVLPGTISLDLSGDVLKVKHGSN